MCDLLLCLINVNHLQCSGLGVQVTQGPFQKCKLHKIPFKDSIHTKMQITQDPFLKMHAGGDR